MAEHNRVIGSISAKSKEVTVIRDGKMIVLHTGDALLFEDIVRSDEGNVFIEKLDGTEWIVEPDSEVFLDESFYVKRPANIEPPDDMIDKEEKNDESKVTEEKLHESLQVEESIERTAEEVIADFRSEPEKDDKTYAHQDTDTLESSTGDTSETTPSGSYNSSSQYVDASTMIPTVDIIDSSDSGVSHTDNLTNDRTPTLAGQAEPNAVITVTDSNGYEVGRTLVDATGHYTLTISPLNEGSQTLNVTAIDNAGNTATAAQSITVDTTDPAPAIKIDDITTDNIISITESGQLIPVTGTVTGDFKDGDTVTVTVGMFKLQTTVDAQGYFSVDVPGTTLAVAAQKGIDVQAEITVTDAAGNTDTATDTHVFSTDLQADATITVDPVTTDNIINVAEAGSTVAITGSVGGDVKDGDTVILTVNGQTYTGAVRGGTYSIDVAGSDLAVDRNIQASVTGTDTAGNTATVTATHQYATDLQVLPPVAALVVDSGGDATDYLSNDGRLIISGQEPNATIEYSVDNGQTWTSGFTPQEGVNSVMIRQTDAAGNVSAGNTFSFKLDTQVSAPTVSLTSDTGTDATDGITSNAQLSVSGEPGATFEYSIDNGQTWASSFTPVEGVNNVQVRQTDAAGNISAPASISYTVDTHADATITIDDITADNIINRAESRQTAVAVTGDVTGDFKDGDTVTLTVGSKTFTGMVDASGHYSIDVPGIDLAMAGQNGLDIHASIDVTDTAGNTVTAQAAHNVTTDIVAHGVIALLDGTNGFIINQNEQGAAQIQVALEPGGSINQVTLTDVNGKVMTIPSSEFTIDAQGHATITKDISSLADGQLIARMQFTDAAGNIGMHGGAATKDTAASATITVDAITTDDIINQAETGQTIPVTGTVTGDFKDGDTVTLTIGTHTLSGTVDASGHYAIDVPGTVLGVAGTQGLSIQAAITVTDSAGNSATATASHAVTADLTADASITIDVVTADNIINANESGGNIAVTGTVGGDVKDGDTVTLSVNGQTYTGKASGGTFSIDVAGSDLAADNNVHASLTGTDAAGNSATAAADHTYSVDTTTSLTISGLGSADDTGRNHHDGVTMKDSVTAIGHGEAGATVVVTDGNGAELGRTVIPGNGDFSIQLPSLAEGVHDLTFTSTDKAGNTDARPLQVTVDQHNHITADLDSTSDTGDSHTDGLTSDTSPTFTGQTDPGAIVVVTDAQGNKLASVTADANGNYAVTPGAFHQLGEGQHELTFTTTDAAGNTDSVKRTITIDTHAEAQISVDNITSDNIINAAEGAQSTVAVTGTVTGDFKDGDTVSILVGHKQFTGTVDASGNYSVDVPGSVLANAGQNNLPITASVTVTDTAGNSMTASADHLVQADLVAIGAVGWFGSNSGFIINQNDQGSAQINVAVEPGGSVTSLTLTDVNGQSITIPASELTVDAQGIANISKDISALADGQIVARMDFTDAAGNTGHTQGAATKDTVADATITINDITSDNVINAQESGINIPVTGTVTGDFHSGDVVTITVGTHHFFGTVDAAGRYAIDVPGVVLAVAGNKGIDIHAEVTLTDSAGNSKTASASHGFTTDMSVTATDATATATEDQTTDSTGQVALDQGATVSSTDVVGQYGTYHFNPDGSFTYSLDNTNPAVQALPDGATLPDPVSYNVQDAAGNTASATVTATITGTNDAAVITTSLHHLTTDRDTVHEDIDRAGNGKLACRGHIDVTDIDKGEAHLVTEQGTSAQGYGTFMVFPNGVWGYFAENNQAAVQELKEGERLTDTFEVHSVDGTSKTITITIVGTNDAPVVSGEVALASGTEDTDVTLTSAQLLANATDADHGETAQLTVRNVNANHGTVTDNGDGTFTFHPDADYNGKVDFTYDVVDPHGVTAQDGHGNAVQGTATMDLAAVQDAAVIGGQTTGDITENAHTLHTLQGMLTIHDPDAGEARFVSVTKIDDPYNTNHNGLIISSSGSWTYQVRDLELQHLAEGETKNVVYEVTTADGTTERITIAVHGTNDAPTVLFQGYGNLDNGRTDAITTDEDKAVTIPYSRMMTFVEDKDTLDTLHVENLKADHGTIHDNGDGTFTFTPEKDFHGRVTFTCDVADNHGASVHTGMTMPVNSVIDHATLTSTGASGDEDTAIALNIQVAEHGGDMLDHVVIVGIPTGATMSAGHAGAGSSWIVDKADLATLTITPPHDFSGTMQLSVTGFTTDGAKTMRNITNSGVLHLDVDVANVVDAPTVATKASTGDEDTSIALHISVAATGDHDSIVHYTISGLPAGATLNHGTNDGHGNWVVPASEIGTLAMTPPANYHGDVSLSVTATATDGTHTADSAVEHLTVTVAPVTDAAAIHMSLSGGDAGGAIETGTGHALAVGHLDGSHLNNPNGSTSVTAEIVVQMQSGSNANPDAVILQLGRAAAKGAMLNNPLALEEQLGDASYYGSHHAFSVTNPHNLTLWMPGHMPIQTGIDMTADSGSHRYTFTVDTATHTATVYEDGKEAFHTDSAPLWHWLSDLNGGDQRYGDWAGNDHLLHGENIWLQGSLNHADKLPKIISERAGDTGLNLGDGLHPLGNDKGQVMGSDGQMHVPVSDLSVQASFTSAVIISGSVSAQQVAAGPLSQTTPGLEHGKVLVDLGVENGHMVDHTHHQDGALANHVLETPQIGAAGDPFHHDLNLDVQPTDPDDHVSSVKLTGLPDGTVLNDGHGHTVTVQGGQAVEVQGWNLSTIGVQLPANAPKGDVPLHVEVTTTGPDGTTATSSADNTSMHVSDYMADQAPDTTDSLMLGTEDQVYQFKEADFAFNDKDGGTMDHVTITDLPDAAQGKIQLNGVDVTAGQDIATADITHLTFVPTPDFNGDVAFKFTVSDGLKDSGEASGTISMDAVNDAPTVAADDQHAVDMGGINEDTHVRFTAAQLLQLVGASDVDGDKLHIETVNIPSQYGAFIKDYGSETFWFYPAKDVNATDIPVTISVSDGHTTTRAHGIIDINPVNDAPTVTAVDAAHAADLGSGQEDQHIYLTKADILSRIGAADVDGDTLNIQSIHVDPQYGSIGKTPTGEWNFMPAPNFHGDVPLEVTITDGTAAPVTAHATLEVTPVNDAPTVTATDSAHAADLGTGLEDQHIYLTKADILSRIGASDVDGDRLDIQSVHVDPQYGSIGKTPTGEWNFMPATNFHGDVPLTVTITDGTAAPVSAQAVLEVAPMIDSTDPTIEITDGTIREAGTNHEGMQVTRGSEVHMRVEIPTSPDPDDHVSSVKISGFLAGYVISDGTHTHTVGSHFTEQVDVTGWDLDHLQVQLPANLGMNINLTIGVEVTFEGPDNQQRIETDHTVLYADAPGARYAGGNDIYWGAAGISGDLSASTDEDTSVSGDIHVSGKVGPAIGNGQMPDQLETAHGTTIQGHYGSLNFDGSGHWTYTPDDRADALEEGHVGTENFLMSTVGGAVAVLQIDVNGTDDGSPVHVTTSDAGQNGPGPGASMVITGGTGTYDANIFGEDSKVTDEDSAVSGMLLVTDPTAAEAHFKAQTDVDGLYGKFSIDALGQWTYTPDDRADALAAGAGDLELFTVESADGTTHQVVVTVTGNNDASTVSDNTGTVTEDANLQGVKQDELQVSGNLHISDVDGHQEEFLDLGGKPSETVLGAYGKFFMNMHGAWLYVADNNNPAIQALNNNQALTDQITVYSKDGTPHDITITINGADEGATVSAPNRVTGNAGSSVMTATQDSVGITDGLHGNQDGTLNAQESLHSALQTLLQPGHTLTGVVIQDTQGHQVDVTSHLQSMPGTAGQFQFSSDLDLSALSDGTLTVVMAYTDEHGANQFASSTIEKDTTADVSITLDPVTGDGVIDDADAKLQNIAVSGHVTGEFKDGDTVTVTVGTQQYQTQVNAQGQFSVDVAESVVADSARAKTGVSAEITVTDDAGNTRTAQDSNPVVINFTPTATLTGETGTHTTVYHATLAAAGATGGWGLQDKDGHQSGTSVTGQYGTLSVNPVTGELTYDASSKDGVQKSGTPQTGTHEEHFIITLGGQQNAQVEVVVELSGQSVHGHSGHFVQHVEVLDMNANPVSVQNDEPDENQEADSLTITLDLDDDKNQQHQDDQTEPDAGQHDIAAALPVIEIPTEDAIFNLEGAGKLIDAQSQGMSTGMEEALKSAATLLGDITTDSKEVKIVEAVDKAESKEHVANPDAPDKSATDTDGSQQTPEEPAEYVPDIHNVINDHDQNDGSGMKG